jgi:hypothetical protein
MLPAECTPHRRNFLKAGVGLAVGLSTISTFSSPAIAADNAWIVGPQPGFTPEIGTLTSMMAFTRDQVLESVKGLSQVHLDFLLDASANTIGALLLHLAPPKFISVEQLWRNEVGLLAGRNKKEVGHCHESR